MRLGEPVQLGPIVVAIVHLSTLAGAAFPSDIHRCVVLHVASGSRPVVVLPPLLISEFGHDVRVRARPCSDADSMSILSMVG